MYGPKRPAAERAALMEPQRILYGDPGRPDRPQSSA
jgi:hypothetical protein